MGVLDSMLRELDESYIAQNVTIAHHKARMMYQLESVTVNSDSEFDDLIADYYCYHFGQCISVDEPIDKKKATIQAKQLIEIEYQGQGRPLNEAYIDGKTGIAGGMRIILDIIANGLAEKAKIFHKRNGLSRYFALINSDEQKDIEFNLQELFNRYNIYDIKDIEEIPEHQALCCDTFYRDLILLLKRIRIKFDDI